MPQGLGQHVALHLGAEQSRPSQPRSTLFHGSLTPGLQSQMISHTWGSLRQAYRPGRLSPIPGCELSGAPGALPVSSARQALLLANLDSSAG